MKKYNISKVECWDTENENRKFNVILVRLLYPM